MKNIELALLVTAYSTIIIAIFLSVICYKRKMENWETIAVAVSLLLLIVSITIPGLVEMQDTVETTSVFTLFAMILVGLTTPLSLMAERHHNISHAVNRLLYIVAGLFAVSTGLAYFFDKLGYLEYPVVIFMGLSVVLSMIFVRMTKPLKSVAHLDKINRIFAILFLIIVPMSLLANYAFSNNGYHLKIGFTLPLVFILLSLNKIIDDLQRLSLIKTGANVKDQHFKNYSLSKREKEVASLLAKGKTYKEITEELFISMPTVKSHANNIYRKCGVKGRHELTLLLIN